MSSRKGLSGREVEVKSLENDKAVDSFFLDAPGPVTLFCGESEQDDLPLKQKRQSSFRGFTIAYLHCTFSIAAKK